MLVYDVKYSRTPLGVGILYVCMVKVEDRLDMKQMKNFEQDWEKFILCYILLSITGFIYLVKLFNIVGSMLFTSISYYEMNLMPLFIVTILLCIYIGGKKIYLRKKITEEQDYYLSNRPYEYDIAKVVHSARKKKEKNPELSVYECSVRASNGRYEIYKKYKEELVEKLDESEMIDRASCSSYKDWMDKNAKKQLAIEVSERV